MKNKPLFRGAVCTMLGGVCWGFSGTCGQYLFANHEITTLQLTCIRLLSAGVILFLISLIKYRDTLKNIWKYPRDVVLLVCYGLFALMFNQYAYMTSISWNNAATTTMMQNLSLVTVMLLTCLYLRRKPTGREVLALVLALFGVYMIATGGTPTQMVMSRQGLLWGLCTTLAATVYTLLPRPLLRRWPQVPILACGMLLGGAVMNITAKSWTFQLNLALSGWLAIAAIVLFGTVLSFTLFLQGIKDLGPVKTAMLAVTEPVSATIFAAAWLGTKFSVTDLIGFAAILATIFLLSKEPE